MIPEWLAVYIEADTAELMAFALALYGPCEDDPTRPALPRGCWRQRGAMRERMAVATTILDESGEEIPSVRWDEDPNGTRCICLVALKGAEGAAALAALRAKAGFNIYVVDEDIQSHKELYDLHPTIAAPSVAIPYLS